MKTNKITIPKTYLIDGKNMMQLPSTPKSGLYKFVDVKERDVHLYETNELPKYILNQLEFTL